MNKQTIRDIDLKGKRIVVRVDYNVPVKDGVVGDTLRIQASFDTLKYLLDQGCSLVLLSHLGEPKGAPDAQYSLKPVAAKAAQLLGRDIAFLPDCVGDEVSDAASKLQPGQILLLENVRFHQEELDNDAAFAKRLGSLGDVYVNDAFAVDHRKQASLVAITDYLPAVSGLLVEKEVNTITSALEHPKRPLVAVVGGAKVSSKIAVLDNLLHKVDALFVGGAMANTFLFAQGQTVGESLYEPEFVKTALDLIAQAHKLGVQLVIPDEVVVSESKSEPVQLRTVDPSQVGPKDIIVDNGRSLGAKLTEALKDGGTVIWNGPVGLFEVAAFAAGTKAIADAIIASDAQSIIGGGDTAAYIDAAGLHSKFSWVSTGGGASLELMAGKKLPGIEALRDK